MQFKQINKNFVSIISLFICLPSFAGDNRESFGLGAGALYNGLGINVGIQSSTDVKYLSIGCTSIGHTSNSGWESDCGIGGSWIKANIFSQENNKHGLGVHIAMTDPDKPKTSGIKKTLGIGYIYFFNGIDAEGWNIELIPTISHYQGKKEYDIYLGFGYQF